MSLPSDVTVGSAVADWLLECSHCRKITIEEITRHSKKWIARWGAERPLHTVSGEDVLQYIREYRGGHAASTTNLERRYLRWFLRHAMRRGAISVDPALATPHYPEEEHEARALSADEVRELLARAESRLAALIVLAVETGLRRRTLLELRWEWVDLERGWVRIPASAMKGRRDYHAPLSPAAIAALRTIRSAPAGQVFPWQRTQAQRWFARIAEKARVDATFHDLRRTFFTRMRERGVSLEVAMCLSDHRDIRTALRHYRAIAPEELLRAVGREPARERDIGSG